MIYFNASSGGSSSITVYDGLIKDAGAYAEFLYFLDTRYFDIL